MKLSIRRPPGNARTIFFRLSKGDVLKFITGKIDDMTQGVDILQFTVELEDTDARKDS